MATVRDITTMCKSGQVQKAYELAKKGIDNQPEDLWQQRALGWALYYMIKHDVENKDLTNLLEHLAVLNSLQKLTTTDDHLIFDNVLIQIASYIKNNVPLDDSKTPSILSSLFSKIKDYTFSPSLGYSLLLAAYIKIIEWNGLADFIDWWNLDNLRPEDYVPYSNSKGKKVMTLAERAFICNSKALLKLKDSKRTEYFLPKLKTLIETHPEMTYPGYYYGKLLISLGSNQDTVLKAVIPFARKKVTEFWVWQLLGEIFINNDEKQLACLLRAIHCHTKETFLGKIRIRLAELYIKKNLLNCARFHIDIVEHCYSEQGWHIPNDIYNWKSQPWIKTTVPEGNEPINYKKITDDILFFDSKECIAIVTFINPLNKKNALIFGYKQVMYKKLHDNVSVGDVLSLHYIKEKDGKIIITKQEKTILPQNLNYAKYVQGIISKKENEEYAFLNAGSIMCFVPPTLVKKFGIRNGNMVKSLIVYKYNKKKATWNWCCVKVKKTNEYK